MLELWRLKRERRRILKLYGADLQKARTEKDAARYHKLIAERGAKLENVTARIAFILGWRLVQQAEKLDVEAPPHNQELGYWESNFPANMYYLTPKGRSWLRKHIDEEKARRREVNMWWIKLLLPFVAALAALVGALTGLVLAFKR